MLACFNKLNLIRQFCDTLKEYNNRMLFCRASFTCVKGFFTMVKELNDLAGQHEQIAENMSSTILKDMQTVVQEVKQERKRVNDKH